MQLFLWLFFFFGLQKAKEIISKMCSCLEFSLKLSFEYRKVTSVQHTELVMRPFRHHGRSLHGSLM